MNKNLRNVIALCAVLLLSVSILAVHSNRSADRMAKKAAAAQAEADALRQKLQGLDGTLPAPSSGMDDDIWRARVGKLKAQLAEKDRRIASLQKTSDTATAPTDNTSTNPVKEERRPWRNRGAWLEEIKESDPKRYEEIQERRKEARENMQRSIAEQADYYLSRDTSVMEEDEFAEYEQMLVLLDETWGLAEQMQSNMPWEERRTIRRTMHDNMEQLDPLLDTERDREFYQIGLDFGYTESEAAEFTDYLNGVIEVTSMRSLYEGMHSGRRGGGGRSSNETSTSTP
jgi:hypothetical protein